MARFWVGDHVRVWKPGYAEHGLSGVVGEVMTIEEYGGPEYRGPHAYHSMAGWHDETDCWFHGRLPDAMVVSEEGYQRAREERPHAGWRK